MSDEKIIKGMPAKRNPASLQTTQDITIPAGSILRMAAKERGGSGYVEIPIGFGKDFTGFLVVQLHPDADASGYFKRVVAS